MRPNLRLLRNPQARPIIVMNINLLFFRYVVYDLGDKMRESVGFQWPWTSLEKFLGVIEVIEF